MGGKGIFFTCILFSFNCFVVTGDSFESEVQFIYDITSVVDHVIKSENEKWAVSSFRKLLRDELIGVHYEGGNIFDINKLSNLTQTIHKIISKHGNPDIFISLSNHINTFKIPDSKIADSSAIFPRLASILFETSGSENCEDNVDPENNHTLAIKHFFNSASIRVGLRSTILCSSTPEFFFQEVNFTTQVGLAESYNIFQKRLESILESTWEFQNSVNFYLKLNPYSEANIANSDLDYNLLFEQFSRKWGEESGSMIILQFSNYNYFPNLGQEVSSIKRESRGRSKLVIPRVPLFSTYSTSSLHRTFRKLSSAFERIYGFAGSSSEIEALLAETGRELSQRINFTYGFYIDEQSHFAHVQKGVLAMVEKGVEIFKQENIHVDCLHFISRSYQNASQEYKNLVKIFSTCCGPFKLNIPDFDNASKLISTTKESCGPIFDSASEITWPVTFSIPQDQPLSFETYIEKVQKILHKILLARDELLKVKNTGRVGLSVDLQYPDLITFKDSKFQQSIYCTKEIFDFNSFYEAIGNWGRIHNFPVIFKETNPLPGRPSWFTELHPGYGISPEIYKNMPEFVLRNFPEHFISWKVDPCVEYTAHLSDEGIPLDKDMSGVSVSLNVTGKGLTSHEIENMMMFALYKFKTAELLPRKDQNQWADLRTLNSLLATDFLEALVDFDILEGQLYLDISIQSSYLMECLEEVKKIVEKVAKGPESSARFMGLHLSDWEDQPGINMVLKEVFTMGKKFNFEVGLVSRNCSVLVTQLVTIVNMTVPVTDYILCETEVFPAANKDKNSLATILNMHLYTSRILKEKLQREIYFRLNSFPCCQGDERKTVTENLFRFLNDVNQFAVGNEIKYFLVQAFTTTVEKAKSSSWFQVEINTEFGNLSFYSDREDAFILSNTSFRAHLSTLTRKNITTNLRSPTGVSKKMQDINFLVSSTPFILIMIGLGGVLLVGIVLVVIGARKRGPAEDDAEIEL